MRKRNLLLLSIACSCLTYSSLSLLDCKIQADHSAKGIAKAEEIVCSNVEKKQTALKDLNPDYVCWLDMQDPSIQLPVVQTDNDAYYLQHAFDRTESGYGTPFFSCHSEAEDPVRIIYGHHVYYDSKAIFSPLLSLTKKDHGSFALKNGIEKTEYIITHVFHLAKNSTSFSLTRKCFRSEEDFQQWIGYADAHSIWPKQSENTSSDRYVILQTCDNDKDHFFVVIGKEVATCKDV